MIIGVAVGWLIAHIRARIEDTPVEMTISLLTPYAAFLPADRLDASGVIATVAAGLYLGHRGSRIMGADARLTGRAVWDTITFLLNGFVFIVMGLEIPLLFRTLTPALAIRLVGIGVAVTRVAGARPRPVDLRHRASCRQRIQRPARTPSHAPLVLSWAGMRGVVSLAAALALPLTLPGGRPFPAREALVIVTLTVIVAHARRARADAAMAHPGAAPRHRHRAPRRKRPARDSSWSTPPRGGSTSCTRCGRAIARCSTSCARRTGTAPSTSSDSAMPPRASAEDQELIEHREIRRTVIDAEREALLRLRAEGEVSDEVLRELERELDLEERRMDAYDGRPARVASRSTPAAFALPDQFDLARPPGLVEERLQRAVEAQEREPALAGHRLDPVAVLRVGWLGRAEIDRRRAVRVRLGGR